MPTPLIQALLFLTEALFGFYALILMLRLILAWLGSNYFDPLVQFIIRLTRGIIQPLRRFIPNVGRLETATALFLFIFICLKFSLIMWLQGLSINIFAVMVLACADLIQMLVYIFFIALILQMLFSWVPVNTSITYFVQRLTSPLLHPVQRVLPLVSGIDLSPIPVMLGLQLILILLVNPLQKYALSLMMG